MSIYDDQIHHAEQRVVNTANDWPTPLAKQIGGIIIHLIAIGVGAVAIYLTALQIAP